MITRCTNPRQAKWKWYGGKGVTVCDRWKDFSAFVADMGDRPEGHTLDRFPDHNGNYEPGNCRWATWDQQIRNKDAAVYLEVDGERLSVLDLTKRFGIKGGTIRARIDRGLAFPQIVGLEPVPRKKHNRSEGMLRRDEELRSLTHCKHGHEFTKDNTMIRPNGTRACRTCRNKRAAAAYSRRTNATPNC